MSNLLLSKGTFALIDRSDLRTRMKSGKLVTAGWSQTADALALRPMAAAHDTVVLDAEHGAFDLRTIALSVEVAANNGCACIVRVPLEDGGDQNYARRCLDAGVLGILFPNVRSAGDALARISTCYYPTEATPWGRRGFGFGGCNQDGSLFGDYAKIANDRVVIGVQLENKDAFVDATMNAILATSGLVFTQDGPYDHSGSYLVPGQTTDPRVVDDLARYRTACKKHGVVAGKHVVWPTEANIRTALTDGYGFVALGTDMQHIAGGSKAVLDIVDAATKA